MKSKVEFLSGGIWVVLRIHEPSQWMPKGYKSTLAANEGENTPLKVGIDRGRLDKS